MDRRSYTTVDENPNFLDFENTPSSDSSDPLEEQNPQRSGLEFDEQLANAQQQLKELRRQEEEIERQKSELEQLRQIQSSFNRGRDEMSDNLQHAITLLERERLDAEQKIQHYSRAQSNFKKNLEEITSLSPEDSPPAQLHTELEHASSVIDDSRDEYIRTLNHLDNLNASDDGVLGSSVNPDSAKLSKTDHRNFGYWLRSGFAFSLPIMVFSAFAFFIYTFLR